MSADNGIYIAKFPDGYRVVHATAIENIDFYSVGSKERIAVLKDYFGKSKIITSYEKAILTAQKMAKIILSDSMCPILEYGINYIGEYEAFYLREKNLKYLLKIL